MAALALFIDRRTENRLLGDIVENGHSVVARLQSISETLTLLQSHPPDVVLVSASRGALSAELLAAGDNQGVRVIALATSDAERRYAAGLGLHEVLDGASSWADIEDVITRGVPVPSRVGDATRTSAAPASVP